MIILKRQICILIGLMGFPICSGAYPSPTSAYDALAFSRQTALEILKDLQGQRPGENLELGEGLAVLSMSLDHLKETKGDIPGDFQNRDVQEVYYPVLSAGTVIAALSVAHEEGNWVRSSNGNIVIVRMLLEQRDRLRKNWEGTDFHVLAIPGLKHYLTVFYQRQEFWLISPVSYPSIGLKAEQKIHPTRFFPVVYRQALRLTNHR